MNEHHIIQPTLAGGLGSEHSTSTVVQNRKNDLGPPTLKMEIQEIQNMATDFPNALAHVRKTKIQ